VEVVPSIHYMKPENIIRHQGSPDHFETNLLDK